VSKQTGRRWASDGNALLKAKHKWEDCLIITLLALTTILHVTLLTLMIGMSKEMCCKIVTLTAPTDWADWAVAKAVREP
jgi:hypothetical protein